MKTPEEMAEEYADSRLSGNGTYEYGMRQGFLAGYQAAKDEELAKDKSIADAWKQNVEKMLPSVHAVVLFPSQSTKASDPDVVAKMDAAIKKAKNELADADKVMPQWISVEERLPEDWDCVLWLAGTDGRFECGWEKNECANSACKTGCGQSFGAGAMFICEFHRKDKHYEQHYLIDDNNDIAFIDCFTHWMPLPAFPEDK